MPFVFDSALGCTPDDLMVDRPSQTSVSASGSESAPVQWRSDSNQRCAYDINVFIGYEMSLVPEVERVFIHKEDEVGKVLRVTVVVDKRDPNVRAEIFKREQAVMDEMKSVDFDFHIIAREGRPLELLVSEAGGGERALL